MIFSETPNLLISQRFARAEGVGLGECKARTAKQPQGPERKQPSQLSSFAFPCSRGRLANDWRLPRKHFDECVALLRKMRSATP